uniref:putative tripartite motif-containing protein 75 n=1 Tax=Jaculus jaculus TaxID=51337 RepID=UPI001E1B2FCC|nr:putative tripartite motif-containing protein 75 [Jaculus jaculus]
MANELSVAELQAEAGCSICLDYLSDPVTTECGHNFCYSCIRQCWEGLQEVFPCPTCFSHCSGQLRINTQLRQVVSVVQQLPVSENNMKQLCEKHGEALDLFCEEDLELLCPQCRLSSDHQHHDTLPIKEAAMRYRRKLKGYAERLQEQIKEIEIQCELQVFRSMKVRLNMRNWKKASKSEFEELKQFLDREEDVMQARLHLDEKDIKEKLKENRNLLSAHVATIRNMVSDIREKCLQADMDFLRTAGCIINTYESIQVPEVFSYELRKESCRLPPHYCSLQKLISTFQVDVTLDVQNVPPDVVISEDRKSMKLAEETNASPVLPPYYVTVPAREALRSGRYFWQVEVRGSGKWRVGVCYQSVRLGGFTAPGDGGSWQIQQSTNVPGVGER